MCLNSVTCNVPSKLCMSVHSVVLVPSTISTAAQLVLVMGRTLCVQGGISAQLQQKIRGNSILCNLRIQMAYAPQLTLFGLTHLKRLKEKSRSSL